MEKYKIIDKLGEGSFGVVHKVLKNGVAYAVKIIREVNFFKKDEVDQECEIMKTCNHPNLVKVHEDFYSEEDQTYYIVMDYCEQGDLLKFVKTKNKNFENKQIISIMKQIVNAFIYLNSQKVIHRDLKPENILVTKGGQIKIADFGCARKSEVVSKIEAMSLDKGTPCFAAPQLLCSMKYSSKCDVWSAGCIIYFLKYKKLPFMAKQVANIIGMIKEKTENKDFELISEIPISQQLKYIIRRCLKFHEIQRSSWREFHLSRVFLEKVTSVKQFIDYLKNISNIANWISKNFWKERKKYKIGQNKNEVFIYYIIKFHYSSLNLGQKIIDRDPEYKYLFEELAWKKQDIDEASRQQFKNVHLKQSEQHFHLIEKNIKSDNALNIIKEKQSHTFLVFADLQNSIRAAYRILSEIQNEIEIDADKVLLQMARWVNFQRYFDFEHKPSLEKILAEKKLLNIKQQVKEELINSISGQI